MNREQLIINIDIEADIIRTIVVGDPVRAFEYQWTEIESLAYKAADYTGAVPPSIASWANAKQWTPQQACDDILAAANSFRYALATIRTIRLMGKEAIKNAATDELAETAYSQSMSSFDALRQQVEG